MSKPLSGRRVLVTRPTHQAQALCTLLQQQGATPVPLPLLDIQAITETSPQFHTLKQQILDLDLFQHVIFISPNAADFGGNWIDSYWPQLPVGINWYAIGQKTATHLDHFGIHAFKSSTGYDSEALLSYPALQQIKDDKVLIMRGEGGRETLADELRARGAEVSYAELYRRCQPEYEATVLEQAFTPLPDAILISSGEGLKNLWALLQPYNLIKARLLRHCDFIVPSERVKDIASQAGLTRITTAAGPDDHAMVDALLP